MNIRDYEKSMTSAHEILRHNISQAYDDYREEVSRLVNEFFGEPGVCEVSNDDSNARDHKYGRDR